MGMPPQWYKAHQAVVLVLSPGHAAVQELSLLAGNKLQRQGSEDLSGMAQFSSAMSAAPPEEPAWNAKFNTFPMAASLPMPPVRSALNSGRCTSVCKPTCHEDGCRVTDHGANKAVPSFVQCRCALQLSC